MMDEQAIGHDEYKDGPWATDWDCYPYNEVVAPPSKDEVEEAIHIIPLKQGFVVMLSLAEDDLAFTDRVDAAEWLLGWLGFNLDDIAYLDLPSYKRDADELYNTLSDCVVGVDYDELEDRDCAIAHVALAAWAYVESDHGWEALDQLVEAVKKWRGIEGG